MGVGVQHSDVHASDVRESNANSARDLLFTTPCAWLKCYEERALTKLDVVVGSLGEHHVFRMLAFTRQFTAMTSEEDSSVRPRKYSPNLRMYAIVLRNGLARLRNRFVHEFKYSRLIHVSTHLIRRAEVCSCTAEFARPRRALYHPARSANMWRVENRFEPSDPRAHEPEETQQRDAPNRTDAAAST